MRSKLILIIQKNRHHFIFILSVILSFILIYNSSSNQSTQSRQVANSIATFFKSPFSRFNILITSAEENEILREQLLVLSLEKESLLEYESENSRLKELLDFKRETKLELIPAKVTNMGLTSTLLSMTIDVGSESGVSKNNPVMTPAGIIGKIASVNKNSSIVQLISDSEFRLGVRFLPSGSTGILRWRSNNICDVREVYKNSSINVGDKVVTSGFSDIFPAGLPVGIVTSVADDRNQFQKIVSVQIEDNLSSQLFVFVAINEELVQ